VYYKKCFYICLNLKKPLKMKKITLSVIALAAISFASCKKDRTCTCTTTVGSYTSTTVTKAKSSKKGAENWCSASQSAVTTDNSGYTGTYYAPSCKVN
jgi:hypothetical protein